MREKMRRKPNTGMILEAKKLGIEKKVNYFKQTPNENSRRAISILASFRNFYSELLISNRNFKCHEFRKASSEPGKR